MNLPVRSHLFRGGVAALLLWHAVDADAQAHADTAERSKPVNVIFDTDMWSDIDDALALAMLHALQDRGEINLLAVTLSNDEPSSASYVDLVNTFYWHDQIPIGIVHGGIDVAKKFPGRTRYMYSRALTARRNPDGSLVYPHRLVDGTQAPEAGTLLRKTLAAQSDASVVMIQVGYSTNLARLLSSGPDSISSLTGRELVHEKVRLLSVMAGNEDGPHRYLIITEAQKARALEAMVMLASQPPVHARQQ